MLVTNVVVGILLSPFILHRLGDSAFGIWVLIFSITGYYGLFDLGIRSSIVRYVSKFKATNDHESLGKLINTSLFSYSCVGALTLILTLALSPHVASIFRISPEFHSTARLLLLIVGASVALGFPLGVAAGILDGLQRFDISNSTGIVALLLRAGFIVVALNHNRGLLTIAIITVSVPLIMSLVRWAIILRICVIPFGWRYVQPAMFRKIFSYSSITFALIVADRLKFKTDEIIIGSMISAAAITYFNIGARIVDYAGEVVIGLAQVLMPMSSRADATGDIDGLRRIFVVGNRFCAFVIFPICATLLLLGKSVIEVWVGRRYVAYSYPVLVIMIVACTIMWSQGASGRILMGTGKHGTWAAVSLIEGIFNVILSVLLVRPYGIVGDSIGTAIPLLCTMIFFMPRHVCRQLDMRIGSYLRQAYALPLLLCIPMIAALILMKTWFVPHTFTELAFHLAVGAVVYGAGLAWAFATGRLTKVSHRSPKSTMLEMANGSVVTENVS
jgi:O-antigen/teichoic acid export membrane protein